MSHAILQGAYFAAIAVVLAMVEIHIEGKNGWAANLPTWRWGPEWFLRWTSRPVTGYHVWMLSLLLLFSHLPLVYLGFSWAGELRVLSLFSIMTIFWDFLWFLLNPAYGWRRFARRDVWWYGHWIGPFPTDYWLGALVSLLLWMARGWFERGVGAPARFFEWAAIFGVLSVVTLAAEIIFGMRATCPVPAPEAPPAPSPPPAPPTPAGQPEPNPETRS